MPHMSTRTRRIVILLAWVASAIAALFIGWWAATQATNPPVVGAPPSTTVTVEVTEGSVTVEQPYGIEAVWPTAPVGVNGYAGTLTSIAIGNGGAVVEAGDIVYTVDLQPVVVLEGAVPAFREMTWGSNGDDIRQLQQFLIDTGHLSGAADGHYRAATANAVNRWSQSLGVASTDVVPLGRIAFVPELPANLMVNPDARVGTRVNPGDELLVGAQAEPQFQFRVLPEAVQRTVAGLAVTIDADGSLWHAEVDRLATEPDDLGATIAILRPRAGTTTICGSECGRVVRLGGTTIVPGALVLVPGTSGAQIPTAAVTTDASGNAFVTLEDGTSRPVTILASHEGKSIVEGVEAGERIVISTPSR